MKHLRIFSSVALATTLLLSAGCSAEKTEAKADADKVSAKTSVASDKSVPKGLQQTLAKKFAQARPDLVVTDVTPSEIEGIYRVSFDGKGSVYASQDGNFFLVGDLFQVAADGIVNVSELASYGPRAKLIAGIDRDDMIVFSPKGEVKASVVVFTDVDCGYCRKLHKEIPKLNEMGVEIKYLAYPRAGVGSNSYKKIASAWCADDKQDAMNKLKSGTTIPNNVCDGNPVAKQFNIGIQAGLNGTPAIILESGQLIPGYMPAEKLVSQLGI